MTDTEQFAQIGLDPIVVIGNLIVLVQRGPDVEVEPNAWHLPGTRVRVGQSMEGAMVERIRAKTGLTVTPLRETFQQSFVRMYDDPARVRQYGTVAFSFLCRATVDGAMRAGPRMTDVQAFRPDQIERMHIGFDHKAILKDAIARLRELGEISDVRPSTFPPPPA